MEECLNIISGVSSRTAAYTPTKPILKICCILNKASKYLKNVKPGFLFWEGKDVLKWEYLSARGLVITPLDTNLVSAIIGLYFGGSLVKK